MPESYLNRLERGPDSEFLAVLSFARSRLREAVNLQIWGYRHFVTGLHPETGHLTATYLLTRNYEQMLQGNSEAITVTLPVEENDLLKPEPVDDPEKEYLTLGQVGDLEGRVTVRRENYSELSQGQSTPLLEGLMDKLISYEVVPLRKLT